MATNVTLSTSVRSNLLALQKTQSAIDVTNSRLNSGKKVNTVVDDAVAYFSAKSLDDRASDFNDRKANIDQAISQINAALTATSGIDTLLKQLKGIVTSAKSANSLDRGDLQVQYATVKAQIDQLAGDASYQGLNLVNNSTAKQTTQFSERSSSKLDVTARRLTTYGATSVNTATLNVGPFSGGTSAMGQTIISGVGLYYAVAVDSVTGTATEFKLVRYNSGGNNRLDSGVAVYSNVTGGRSLNYTQFNNVSGLNVFAGSQIYIMVDSQLTGGLVSITATFSTGTVWSAAAFDVNQTVNANDQFTQALDYLISSLDNGIAQNNAAAKSLGTNVAILSTRLEFTKEYVNVQKEGAGKLTLADTNEEGANLVSLQTRQQLGVQALSFAGQTEQSVLRLFG